MNVLRDEEIVCAECGDSFLFTAAEAASYAERGLVAPPKRCKSCRASRRRGRGRGAGADRAAARHADASAPQAIHSAGTDAAAASDADGADDEDFPMPSTSGDVNEYRSPMAGGFTPPQAGRFGGPRPFGPRPRRAGRPLGGFRQPAPPVGRDWSRDGVYRAPSFSSEVTARNGAGATPRPRAEGGRRPSPEGRRLERPRGPGYAITCTACGSAAEVPFKPIEGRDVFCPSCYRARKPLASG